MNGKRRMRDVLILTCHWLSNINFSKKISLNKSIDNNRNKITNKEVIDSKSTGTFPKYNKKLPNPSLKLMRTGQNAKI